jgi:glycosyltransferase involved in cell wall biosynthesis
VIPSTFMPLRLAAGRLYHGARSFARERQIQRSLAPAVALERQLLEKARRLHAHVYATLENPLVSVAIATYNRSELLIERALTSVLSQTYKNLDIVIVGDCCTDDTEARVAQVRDPRIRFFNLPRRTDYPSDPAQRWLVAGSVPSNMALDLARGHWVAHLDDDDVFTPDHIDVLLRASHDDAELVYGVCKRESMPGEWIYRGDPRFETGICLPSASLARAYLRVFRWDPGGYVTGLAQDKHRWRRMHMAGVRTRFIDRVVAYAPLRPGTTRLGPDAEDHRG